jgi:tetratricopeptide (TPR) repeat protein
MNRRTILTCQGILVGLWILVFSQAKAEVSDFSCGPLQNAYGPFDYRSDKDKLPIVEGAHFTPEVASLIRGKTGPIGGDLDYTLRAFPNHPEALMAMVRLGEKEKTTKPTGTRYTVECWLHRAVRFRDNDASAKMIYAIYLAKKGHSIEALKQLNGAAELNPDSANLQYNIGLVYFDLGKFDESLKYAHLAYQAGFPLPGLRDKLKRAGKWKEPITKSDSSKETAFGRPTSIVNDETEAKRK